MSLNRGLVQNDKYFTQFGQLRVMGRSEFGDPTQTSLSTIRCLVYQEDIREDQTVPAVGKVVRHFACIPSSVSVSRGDHLTAVTDKFGRVVVSDSRVVDVVEYNHWRHGSRFFRLELDLELS